MRGNGYAKKPTDYRLTPTFRRDFVSQGLTLMLMACAKAESTSEPIRTIRAPDIDCVVWSLDGQYIGGSDFGNSYVAIWNVKTGQRVWRIRLDPPAMSLPVAFAQASNYLATVCQSGNRRDEYYACLLAAGDGSILRSLTETAPESHAVTAPTAIVASGDQRVLAVATGSSSVVYLVGLEGDAVCKQIGPIMTHHGTRPQLLSELALSPNGSRLAVSLYSGEVQVFDTATGSLLCKIRPYVNLAISGLAFANEDVLVTSTKGNAVIAVERSGNWQGYIIAPDELDSLSATRQRRCSIRVWHLKKARLWKSFPDLDPAGTNPGSLAANSDFVVALSQTGVLQKWDLRSSRMIFRGKLAEDRPLLATGRVAICSANSNIAVAFSNKITVIG